MRDDTMTAIKERPILFSAPMVRAILDGRKTVTRRPVKGSALKWLEEFVPEFVALSANELCPFGQIGDRLYVRETFNRTNPGGAEGVFYYRADGEFPKSIGGGKFTDAESWKPSIHMPREASRILLEITDVRVERLQDISEGQAQAEGIVGVAFRPDDGWPICTGYMVGPDDGKTGLETTAAKAFAGLWKSTGGDWDANPWVWVVEFKRVTP